MDCLFQVNTHSELSKKKKSKQENQLTQSAAFLPTEEVVRHGCFSGVLALVSGSVDVRWIF